jgi:hypothetical protein
MPRAGFEPAIPATKRPQTYALDLAATDFGLRHKGRRKTGIVKELIFHSLGASTENSTHQDSFRKKKVQKIYSEGSVLFSPKQGK